MKVAIDTETGGLIAGWNEVIEITFLPLDDRYYPLEDIKFMTQVRPEHPDRVELGALIANKRVARDVANKEAAMAEAMKLIMQYPLRVDTLKAFGEWHAKHVSGQMAPLCHNLHFDMNFLEHWFMPAQSNAVSIKSLFNYQGRDTQRIAMYIQDKAKAAGVSLPFRGVSLPKLTQHFGIEHGDAHTSLGDARATAAVYRKLCRID